MEYLQKNQKTDEKQYLNHYPVLKDNLTQEFFYKEIKLEKAKEALLYAGYIIDSGTRLCITEEGKKFFEDYHRFRLLGTLGQFTQIFNKNFIPIIAIFSLTISILSFFFQHSR